MIELSITEPKIEKFFNHSKEEIFRALNFLVDNNIREFNNDDKSLDLSMNQKKELDTRIESFHNDTSIGRSWEDIKKDLTK